MQSIRKPELLEMQWWVRQRTPVDKEDYFAILGYLDDREEEGFSLSPSLPFRIERAAARALGHFALIREGPLSLLARKREGHPIELGHCIKEIDKGNRGTVYKVALDLFPKVAALKVGNDFDGLISVQHEARVLHEIHKSGSFPSLQAAPFDTLHGGGVCQGFLGELYEEDLYTKLEREGCVANGGISLSLCCDLLIHLVDLLSSLAQKGLYPRDIRLENLFVKKGKIVLGDLGCIEEESALQRENSSFKYSMAPSILRVDRQELSRLIQAIKMMGPNAPQSKIFKEKKRQALVRIQAFLLGRLAFRLLYGLKAQESEDPHEKVPSNIALLVEHLIEPDPEERFPLSDIVQVLAPYATAACSH